MSDLTRVKSAGLTLAELVERAACGDYLNYANVTDMLMEIAALLRTHDAEIIVRAKREQLLADMAAITAFDFIATGKPQEVSSFGLELIGALNAAYAEACGKGQAK